MLKKLKQFLSKANFADDNTLESGISTGSTLSKNDIGKLPSTAEEFKDAGDKALNTNELEQAERHYKQSITINPNYADAHINLSVLYRMKRQYEEANTCLQKAKQLDPVDAYVDFNLATTAQLQGNTLLAIRHFQDAIAINNTFEIAYVDLFNLQHQLSDLSGAEKTINQALKFIPESAECHYLLGNLEKERGNLELSTTAYQQALTINPDLLQAHVFLGAVLEMQGKLEESAKSYSAVVKLVDASMITEAQFYLAVALAALGRKVEAERVYRKFLVIKPDSDKAYYNLAQILNEQGRAEESVASYRTAISLNPNYVDSYNNLGIILTRQSKFNEAIAVFLAGLSIKPDSFEILTSLGNCYRNLGDYQKAIAFYRKAIESNPESDVTYINLFFSLSSDANTSLAQYYAEVSAYGKKIQDRAEPYTQWSVDFQTIRTQPLKVGLVSGDMRIHPVGFFLENIVKHLDKTRIQLHAYSTELYQDELTSKIKENCIAWNYIGKLTDKGAAEKIHGDGIDILIDLNGYTGESKLPMFCWKPAPVQVSWLGYFASTGIPTMDYLLADFVSVPEAHRQYYTETIQYLPKTRFCFTPPKSRKQLKVVDLPALSKGYITFGSFQRLEKISDNVLSAWGEIFKKLPQTKLRLQNKDYSEAAVCQTVLARFSKVGIAADRIMFYGAVSREAYLEAHAEVDIILDTFPYAGGTTTCEALWMGVPTLTLAGNKMIELQGASLMTAAGYAEWVAIDIDDYMAKAIQYAQDVDELVKLRQDMREKVKASLVFNAEKFSKNLEVALFDMWNKKVQELST